MSRSIVLMGVSGAGKSTVGPLLAEALGTSFIDVDAAIEVDEKQTIADIFVIHGEPHFRQLEETATIVALQGGGVVALGGGAVMNQSIRAALKDHDVVWLECSISTAAKRIGMDTARPLLLGNVRSKLIKLLNERIPIYRAAATVTVQTDHRPPQEIVAEIRKELAR
jgi:shikimate kinase